MPVAVPVRSPFGKKAAKKLIDFSGGLNNKFSPLLIDDKELQDIQNFNYDEKGALTKRKGFLAHYAATFNSSPARDSYNYRKQDGTSRLVLAASDKLYADNPQFVRLYDVEADWETVGVQTSNVSTSTVSGDIVLNQQGPLGLFLLGTLSALLGGPVGASRSGTWQSEAINISAVSNQTSGVVAISQTLPASTTITVKTRTSADGSTGWSAYAALGASNTIVSPANSYLQVQVTMTSTVPASPSVQSLQVTFDTTATVTQIASGKSTLARYLFATQNDILYIFNGADANMKWDGTTFGTQGGTPPTAKYVQVHKNIMFLAGNSTNPSRLYFSDIALPESWPALNFIDVGKGDGDQITGLAILLDRLVITKNNSVWLLEGDAASNFILRRTTNIAGCVDQHSIVTVKNTLGMLARDGFYFFDGVNMVLASEKIYSTFNALNSSQFGLVAAIYDPTIRKVFVSVPSAAMTSNDTVLVYDELRVAWTIYKGINAASWVIWRQFNTDHLLFGDASVGQLYDAETGYSDNGAAIAGYIVTKEMDLGGTELAKNVMEVFLDAKEKSGTGDTTANLSFFKDLSTTESSTISVTVTQATASASRVSPSAVGAGQVRSIAVKVAHSSATASITIYGVTTEYVPLAGLRQTT
jgi:hypothetical protein